MAMVGLLREIETFVVDYEWEILAVVLVFWVSYYWWLWKDER